MSSHTALYRLPPHPLKLLNLSSPLKWTNVDALHANLIAVDPHHCFGGDLGRSQPRGHPYRIEPLSVGREHNPSTAGASRSGSAHLHGMSLRIVGLHPDISLCIYEEAPEGRDTLRHRKRLEKLPLLGGVLRGLTGDNRLDRLPCCLIGRWAAVRPPADRPDRVFTESLEELSIQMSGERALIDATASYQKPLLRNHSAAVLYSARVALLGSRAHCNQSGNSHSARRGIGCWLSPHSNESPFDT